jgi:hypothetical protein
VARSAKPAATSARPAIFFSVSFSRASWSLGSTRDNKNRSLFPPPLSLSFCPSRPCTARFSQDSLARHLFLQMTLAKVQRSGPRGCDSQIHLSRSCDSCLVASLHLTISIVIAILVHVEAPVACFNILGRGVCVCVNAGTSVMRIARFRGRILSLADTVSSRIRYLVQF